MKPFAAWLTHTGYDFLDCFWRLNESSFILLKIDAVRKTLPPKFHLRNICFPKPPKLPLELNGTWAAWKNCPFTAIRENKLCEIIT